MGEIGKAGVYTIVEGVLGKLQPKICKSGDENDENKIYCKPGYRDNKLPAAFKLDFSLGGLFTLWDTPSSIRFCNDYTTWFNTVAVRIPKKCSRLLDVQAVQNDADKKAYEKGLAEFMGDLQICKMALEQGKVSGQEVCLALPGTTDSVAQEACAKVFGARKEHFEAGYVQAAGAISAFNACIMEETSGVDWDELWNIQRECIDGMGKYQTMWWGKGGALLVAGLALLFRRALGTIFAAVLPPFITGSFQKGWKFVDEKILRRNPNDLGRLETRLKQMLDGAPDAQKPGIAEMLAKLEAMRVETAAATILTGKPGDPEMEKALMDGLLGGKVDPVELLKFATEGPEKVDWIKIGFPDGRPKKDETLTRAREAAAKVCAVAEFIEKAKAGAAKVEKP